MESLPPLWTIPLGMFAGMLSAPLLTHWLGLFLAAIGKDPESQKTRTSTRRSLTAIVLATILHPVSWALFVAVPYGVIRLLTHPPRAEWVWFIGSAVASLVGLFIFAFVVTYRLQRRNAQQADAKEPGTDHVA